ncbi:MAG: transcription elongation factor subunit Spt4 [Candidatus Nitrosocaldus sp.]
MKEYACRRCKAITTGKVCPVCKSADLSADWYGLVLVVNPAESKIARLLNITQKGKYAMKVT